MHVADVTVKFLWLPQNLLKALGAENPAIVQSMYIFKNAGQGGEVTPHQDATFVHSHPERVTGLWFPLEDATEQNGCLWFVPGSHTGKLYSQWIRKTNGEGVVQMEYNSSITKPNLPDQDFIPAPAQKGSCVLIHDLVVHRSSKNTSPFPRPAYTFHVWDKHDSKYSTENWLQPTDMLPFTSLYDVEV